MPQVFYAYNHATHDTRSYCTVVFGIAFPLYSYREKWGEVMLPEEYYEDACKLFYTWLRRLEERDKRNVTAKRSQPVQQQPRFTEKTGEQDKASEELHHAYAAAHLSSDEPDYTSPSGLSLPSLPPREYARTNGKRKRRNAKR
jgi:hypothetical protein